jgi:sugar lactone lactonase YvrE
MEVETVTDERAVLGESPLWHRSERALYWVDIHGQKVFRYDPTSGDNRVVHDGESVTALGEVEDGGLLLVTSGGVSSLRDGVVSSLSPLNLPEGVRTNDGKCGPDGRLWFGTMDLEASRPIGELFCFGGGSMRSVRDDVILSNGIGWSPDGSAFYHVDSMRRMLFRYSYDLFDGEISDKTVLVDMTGNEAVPDGLAVDRDGNIWVAMYDGWRLDVYDASGAHLDIWRLGVQKPTSVAFAGDDLDDLYITTASEHLSPEDLRDQPRAGELLRFSPGVAGLPVGVFRRR